MQWVACDFAQGPLRFVLIHVTADPLGVLMGSPDCRALVSARCVLRSGMVYGIGMQGPRDALVDACRVLAGILPQHGYDESFFSDVDREIGDALQAAGYAAVRASLERNAAIIPGRSAGSCGAAVARRAWPPAGKCFCRRPIRSGQAARRR